MEDRLTAQNSRIEGLVNDVKELKKKVGARDRQLQRILKAAQDDLVVKIRTKVILFSFH